MCVTQVYKTRPSKKKFITDVVVKVADDFSLNNTFFSKLSVFLFFFFYFSFFFFFCFQQYWRKNPLNLLGYKSLEIILDDTPQCEFWKISKNELFKL